LRRRLVLGVTAVIQQANGPHRLGQDGERRD
jgi:hypothetical protein